MQVKFWGTRGSIPCPGADTIRYGGNTSCLQVIIPGREKALIIDGGSGIRNLGNYLMGTMLPKGPIKADIFLTHTHWDHILGFPFFTPIYIPTSELIIYGPVSHEDEGLDRVIGDQLRYRYFPVQQSELRSKIEYVRLKECEMDLGGGLKVKTKYLNHPIICLGYRFEFEGKVFCTAYDTEPFLNLFPTDPSAPGYDKFAAEEGQAIADEENAKFVEFIRDADTVVYDAQYTRAEYKKGKQGWGHTPYEDAINFSALANVKNLYFFHHDIMRRDEELDRIALACNRRLGDRPNMKIFIAAEGQTVDV